MEDQTELLIATGNQGKLREMRAMLSSLPLRLIGLDTLRPPVVEVEETGATFAENAALKASAYAIASGKLTLADDSGLEVDALHGRPGVLSARYGGVDTPFSAKIGLLLAQIGLSPSGSRFAQFVCAVAIASPEGKILCTSAGICPGLIAETPRGEGGFGYDPVFIPDGFDRTFGELPDTIKAKISHRARAIEQIIPFLRDNNAI